jgi:hypothetical protein
MAHRRLDSGTKFSYLGPACPSPTGTRACTRHRSSRPWQDERRCAAARRHRPRRWNRPTAPTRGRRARGRRGSATSRSERGLATGVWLGFGHVNAFVLRCTIYITCASTLHGSVLKLQCDRSPPNPRCGARRRVARSPGWGTGSWPRCHTTPSATSDGPRWRRWRTAALAMGGRDAVCMLLLFAL